MSNFGWVDALVGQPGIKIERLTTKGRIVVVITSREYMSVFQRTKEEKGFGRVPKRRQIVLMEKVRQNKPKVESITL